MCDPVFADTEAASLYWESAFDPGIPLCGGMSGDFFFAEGSWPAT